MKYINRNSGIYGIFSGSACLYIGCTKNFYDRYNQHVKMLNNQKHHNEVLQEYSEIVGVRNLRFEVIFPCSEKDLILYERYFIKFFSPIANANLKAIKATPNYEKEYTLMKEKFAGQKVNARQLSLLLDVNLKRVGMICAELGIKKKKISTLGGQVLYEI